MFSRLGTWSSVWSCGLPTLKAHEQTLKSDFRGHPRSHPRGHPRLYRAECETPESQPQHHPIPSSLNTAWWHPVRVMGTFLLQTLTQWEKRSKTSVNFPGHGGTFHHSLHHHSWAFFLIHVQEVVGGHSRQCPEAQSYWKQGTFLSSCGPLQRA